MSDDPLLKQAWHGVDRDGAERLLLKQAVGTFLFRKDHFATTLQATLSKSFKKTVHCYTLSYLDSERIVRDKTVVYIDHQWAFYDDDPTLSTHKLQKLEHLLHSLRLSTLHPLSRHAA